MNIASWCLIFAGVVVAGTIGALYPEIPVVAQFGMLTAGGLAVSGVNKLCG